MKWLNIALGRDRRGRAKRLLAALLVLFALSPEAAVEIKGFCGSLSSTPAAETGVLSGYPE